MKLNKIKTFLKKKFPKPFFDLIYFFWKIIIKPIFLFYEDLRLTFFKKEVLKDIDYEGIKFKLFINPKNGTVDNDIFLHNVYESYFLSILKKELKEGAVFVDIGANIGQHSLFASQIVGDKGKVISFEPIPRIFEQFSRSVEENRKYKKCNNILLHNIACGDVIENMYIYICEDNVGASSLVTKERVGEKISVKIDIADKILETEKRIDFIKIDVEGFEWEVLKGLEYTIKKFRPKLFLEYSPFYYRLKDPEIGKKILDFFFLKNYYIYNFQDDYTYKSVDVNFFVDSEKNNLKQTNLLLIPK